MLHEMGMADDGAVFSRGADEAVLQASEDQAMVPAWETKDTPEPEPELSEADSTEWQDRDETLVPRSLRWRRRRSIESDGVSDDDRPFVSVRTNPTRPTWVEAESDDEG